MPRTKKKIIGKKKLGKTWARKYRKACLLLISWYETGQARTPEAKYECCPLCETAEEYPSTEAEIDDYGCDDYSCWSCPWVVFDKKFYGSNSTDACKGYKKIKPIDRIKRLKRWIRRFDKIINS